MLNGERSAILDHFLFVSVHSHCWVCYYTTKLYFTPFSSNLVLHAFCWRERKALGTRAFQESSRLQACITWHIKRESRNWAFSKSMIKEFTVIYNHVWFGNKPWLIKEWCILGRPLKNRMWNKITNRYIFRSEICHRVTILLCTVNIWQSDADYQRLKSVFQKHFPPRASKETTDLLNIIFASEKLLGAADILRISRHLQPLQR